LNGTNLIALMEKKPDVAIGYIVGVHDTTNGLHHCAKTKASVDEVLKLALDHLVSLSGELLDKYSADAILAVAFKKQWPCPNRNSI